MENNSQNRSATLGVEEPQKKELTEEQVRKWLKHDLSVAISCLNAIQSDPDLMESVAMFLHGRFINQKNREAREAERKADLKG